MNPSFERRAPTGIIRRGARRAAYRMWSSEKDPSENAFFVKV
jgi:hypothetical protein